MMLSIDILTMHNPNEIDRTVRFFCSALANAQADFFQHTDYQREIQDLSQISSSAER